MNQVRPGAPPSSAGNRKDVSGRNAPHFPEARQPVGRFGVGTGPAPFPSLARDDDRCRQALLQGVAITVNLFCTLASETIVAAMPARFPISSATRFIGPPAKA